MKRPGSSNLDGATTTCKKKDGATAPQAGRNEGKKKSKIRAAEAKEEDGGDKKGSGEAAVLNLEKLMGWEEWPWLRGAADEQMTWGSVWSPFWDVDFVDRAYGLLFSDVAWDDDIWNLKTVMEIPKP